MNHLLFIRHSAVFKDPTISSHNWQLSEDGRARTHALLPRLTPYQPTYFITSHERKAIETGQILAEAQGKPCTTAPGLQEHDRTGTPYFPNQVDFETAVSRLFTYPSELAFGRETADHARTRFTRTIHTLLTQHPDDTLAIVTHGTVLTLFLAHHNPHLDPISFWRNLQLPDLVVVTPPQMKIIEAQIL